MITLHTSYFLYFPIYFRVTLHRRGQARLRQYKVQLDISSRRNLLYEGVVVFKQLYFYLLSVVLFADIIYLL